MLFVNKNLPKHLITENMQHTSTGIFKIIAHVYTVYSLNTMQKQWFLCNATYKKYDGKLVLCKFYHRYSNYAKINCVLDFE